MKVRELIEFLKDCDPDRVVVVDGYEGGIKELQQVILTDIFLDYHAGMNYYGPHELEDVVWATWDEFDKYKKESVVYLPR